MKLSAALVLLLAVATSCSWALRLPTLKIQPFSEDQTPCETCLKIVEDAEDYLASPATQDTVVTFLQDNLCSLLPKDSSRTCSQEARVLVAQAVASMEQKITPEVVCTYMGTCGTGALAVKLAHAMGLDSLDAQGFPVECPVCKLVMTNVVQRLKDPTSREEIYKAALEACADITEPEGEMKCRDDIEQLFASLDALLDDLDANRACKVLQFCGDASERVAPPAGIVALRQLPSRLNEIQKKRSEFEAEGMMLGDEQGCQACESVLSEAVSILMNPDTQKEVLDFVKQSCDSFDDYKMQCVEYVDTYGPMAFGMVITYLQPLQFCTRIGYCDGGAVSSTY